MSQQPEALRLAGRTCKTCKHFDGLHAWQVDFGYCNIILPPCLHIGLVDNTVHKNSKCDLHTATKAEGEQE